MTESVNRVAVVTGGSRGIGRAVVSRLARDGYDVLVGYAGSQDAAEQAVAEVEQCGGRAVAVQADVADEAAVRALFDAAEAAFGPVAGLVNNAGALAPASPLADMSLERWRRTIDTNLTGAFLCAREAVRRMAVSRGGGGGAVVNLSSMAAVLGAPGEYVDYAAAKGGLDALTTGLAREVAVDGVRVNAVRPGLIATEIHADGGDAGRPARLASTVPMARVGSAEEVAEAVVWLLSERASYCSGATLNVSGGR